MEFPGIAKLTADQTEGLAKFKEGLKAALAAMEKVQGFGPDYISFSYGCRTMSPMSDQEAADRLDRSRWLTAFMVEGGSEGYYIHVGTVLRSEVPESPLPNWADLALVKHLGTVDEAHEMLKAINTFLMGWAG